MKQISSKLTPVYSVLGMFLPLGFFPLAFVFGRQREWLPVAMACAGAIALFVWWFFVLRAATNVFVDESGLVIRPSGGDVRIPFGAVVSIRLVSCARSEIYRVRYRAAGSGIRNFVLIPPGLPGRGRFPHQAVKELLEKIHPDDRRREMEGELNRSYLAPFG